MKYKVVVFGVKDTSENIIRFIHETICPVDLIVTIDKSVTEKNQVSGYKGLNYLTDELGIPVHEAESYFLTDEKTQKFFNENEFLEQRHYNTEYGVWKYGLHISELENKPYSLFIVDRQGYKELQNKLGEDKLVSIFIEVSEEELKRRNKLRGDCPKEFSRRLKSDIEEFKGYISDYIVYNDNLEDAVKKVKEIITDEM